MARILSSGAGRRSLRRVSDEVRSRKPATWRTSGSDAVKCGVPPEAVDLAEAADGDGLDAGLGEQPGEVLALVAQRVVLGGRDQGRRQGAQPVGEQGREVGVVRSASVRGVLLPVPGGLARVEAVGRRCGRTGSRRAGRGTGRPGRRPRRTPGLRSAATSARLPPALSPWATSGRPGRGRALAAQPADHRVERRRARPGTGPRAAGGSRRSGPPPAAVGQPAAEPSWTSMSWRTKPPPWGCTTSPGSASAGG